MIDCNGVDVLLFLVVHFIVKHHLAEAHLRAQERLSQTCPMQDLIAMQGSSVQDSLLQRLQD